MPRTLQKPRDPYRSAVETPPWKGARPTIVHEPELRQVQQYLENLINIITTTGLPNAPDPSLLFGRGDSGAGPLEFITLGSGLAMTGTTLSATAAVAPVFGFETIDFGAFPGQSNISVDIAEPSVTLFSVVNAWIYPANTADHSADEHAVESIKVCAGNIVDGVGFTIYARNDSELYEPGEYALPITINTKTPPDPRFGPVLPQGGGGGTLLYGQWLVGWMVAQS